METTWRTLLEEACIFRGDKFDELQHTLTLHDLDEVFSDDFGSTEGVPFTAWSRDWVYFPYCYDGSEGVASVPRNPCSIATEHIGGG